MNNEPIQLTTAAQEHSALAQSFRSVLASIRFSDASGKEPSVIVVTSPNAEEGKTTIASNLAITLAEAHMRVLLIDGDIHRPRLHHMFGLSNTAGVTDLLAVDLDAPRPTLMETVQETKIPGLFLLSAGTHEAHNSLLQPAGLMQLIREAKIHFNRIVIDTPPVLELADARLLGRCADGVILIARAGTTTRQSAMIAHQRLTDDGIHVLGTILNDWDPKLSPGAYYRY